MLTPDTFTTFTDAYVAVLRLIHDQPVYHTAGRGKNAIEVPNISFRLDNPASRTPYLVCRRTNIVFNHAELLWYLAARNDLAMISYYAPRLARYSADRTTLTGTAYGPRLFAPDGPDGLSQFDRVLDALREDPDSKRAAMVVMQPHEQLAVTNPDVACTLGLQFMLRGGALHATTYMRGNDAFLGLLNDTFSFTAIHEIAAGRLGATLGTYTHHVGSMHINVDHIAKVTALLAEADAGHTPQFPTVAMPGLEAAELDLLLEWEERLRTGRDVLTVDAVTALPLPGYWRQVLLLFEAYRQIQQQNPVTAEVSAALTPAHRWLLATRFPTAIPAGEVAGVAS